MPRRIKLSTREEWKTLAIIFLAAGIPLVATAALIVVSMRPDLGNIRFFHAAIETEEMTIDWPTLYRLNAKDPTVEYIRALLPTSPVRIPGYMITFEQTPDKNREVTQFLLVPDPGNWLHPPHLDPGADGSIWLANTLDRGLGRFCANWGTFITRLSPNGGDN